MYIYRQNSTFNCNLLIFSSDSISVLAIYPLQVIFRTTGNINLFR